jgi:hypothetical protein
MEKEYKSGAGKYINREMTSEQTRAGFTTRRRVAVLKLRGEKKLNRLLKLIFRSGESPFAILYFAEY